MYNEISTNKRNSFLLISLFFAVIILLGFIFGYIFFDPYLGLFFAFFISLIFTLVSYYSGDKMILAMTGAKEARKPEHTYLINTVEGLSIAAGLPTPRIYVINDSAINAFASGRSPEHSIVAVTSGAIGRLNREELEGVIAHEISHIKNYDVRFMMLVATLVGITVLISDMLLRSFFWSRGDRENKANTFIIVIGLVLAILTPIIVQLIKFAISRKREFLADASGALLTRYPPGLASALKKIRDDKEPVVEVANRATAHLFIENPLRHFKKHTSNIFSTHPEINERIRRLESM
ncbi:M48 family metalloprotease [Candidatus Woesearchaeota archaeon]|nr:M48 family metalloprotease [Candidatus Woesearchaeota archaeon]